MKLVAVKQLMVLGSIDFWYEICTDTGYKSVQKLEERVGEIVERKTRVKFCEMC